VLTNGHPHPFVLSIREPQLILCRYRYIGAALNENLKVPLSYKSMHPRGLYVPLRILKTPEWIQKI
jgi:hypothetical protein